MSRWTSRAVKAVPGWRWWLVATAAVLLVAVAAWYRLAVAGAVWWRFGITLLAYAIIVASGLLAWVGRPYSLTGPLLCAWGLIDIGLLVVEAPAVLLLGDALLAAIFVHLLLSYPSGALGRFERRFVGAAYAAVVPCVVVPDGVRRGALVVYGIVFVVLLVRRLRHCPPAERRTAWPVAIAAIGPVMSFGLGEILWAVQPARFWWEAHWWLDRATIFWVPAAMALSLLSRSLARTDAAELLAALPAARPPDLRLAVATLLRDPTADILVRADDPPGFRDLAGNTIAYDPACDPRAAVDLGQGVALLHDPSLGREDPKLLAAGVAAVRLVLDHDRLATQVQGQLAEVERSRSRILHAAYDERRRVERDLHDGAQQSLLGVGFVLQLARNHTADGSDAAQLIEEAQGQLRASLDELRTLARGLRPAMLAERGVEEAIGDLVRRCPLPVTVDVALAGRLPDAVELTAYFVVAESLQNAVRHARASTVDVTVAADGARLRLRVRDDGVGGATAAGGTGLRGLTDRVAALGGELDLRSDAGAGTTLTAWLPLPAEHGVDHVTT